MVKYQLPATAFLRFGIANIIVAAHVKTLRTAAQLTQRALADLLGVSESTVARLEAGRLTIDTRWSSHLTLLFAHLLKTKGE